MRPPDYPQPGPLRLEWGRAVVDSIRALWPVETPTVRPATTGGGTGYHSKPASAPPGTPARIYRPFELVASSTAGNNPRPRVRVVKSHMLNQYPEGFADFDDPPFLLPPKPGKNVVWGKMTEEDGAFESPELGHGEQVPSVGTNERDFYVVIGQYEYTEATGNVPASLSTRNDGYGPVAGYLCEVPFSRPVRYAGYLVLTAGPEPHF